MEDVDRFLCLAIIQGDLNVWVRMISDTVDTEYIQSSVFYVYIIVSVYASKKAMRAILLIYPLLYVMYIFISMM